MEHMSTSMGMTRMKNVQNAETWKKRNSMFLLRVRDTLYSVAPWRELEHNPDNIVGLMVTSV